MSQGIHLDRGAGTAYWLLTSLFTFKLTGAETNGALSIAELDADPAMGPPPHIHRKADEYFYILEGTFDFSLDGRPFSAGPGAFVHLPRGIVHTHSAGAGKPARALVIQSPAGVEKFIAEAGSAATDRSRRPAPPDAAALGRIVTIAAQHGIDVPPAPVS
jgi:quercetin dioxygenase-like cupin family protein